MCFVNTMIDISSKLGMIVENKVFQKLKLSKIAPKQLFIIEKKCMIWMILHLKNSLLKSDFVTFLKKCQSLYSQDAGVSFDYVDFLAPGPRQLAVRKMNIRYHKDLSKNCMPEFI